MTYNCKVKEEYLKKISECFSDDIESGHMEADNILCELVQKYCPFGKEIVNKFVELPKWYA